MDETSLEYFYTPYQTRFHEFEPFHTIFSFNNNRNNDIVCVPY